MKGLRVPPCPRYQAWMAGQLQERLERSPVPAQRCLPKLRTEAWAHPWEKRAHRRLTPSNPRPLGGRAMCCGHPRGRDPCPETRDKPPLWEVH